MKNLSSIGAIFGMGLIGALSGKESSKNKDNDFDGIIYFQGDIRYPYDSGTNELYSNFEKELRLIIDIYNEMQKEICKEPSLEKKKKIAKKLVKSGEFKNDEQGFDIDKKRREKA